MKRLIFWMMMFVAAIASAPAQPTPQYASKPLFGSGAPSASCAAINVGQLYFDSANSYAQYVCKVTGGVYAWYLPSVTLANFTGNVTGGAVQVSSNTQINVMASPYGAKGDCSTDDTAAFAAAQTAALAYAVSPTLPGVLYLPKPPGGCYVVNNLVWKGVSFEGQPSGLGSAGGRTGGVAISSSPGHSILQVPDPTYTSGAISLREGWSIRNVSFILNNSVACADGTPCTHRWPGRWFDDGAMTSGSNAFASTNADISCSDIGEPIQVNGAGAAGANLVTTIANVTPCWKSPVTPSTWIAVTLAANASTTVTNARSYISLFGLPVTQNLGQCAICVDMQDGNPAHWTASSYTVGNYPKLENVSFNTTSGTNHFQYTSGIYTQGNPALYGLDARNVAFYNLFSGASQVGTELNSFLQPSSGDYEKWDHVASLFGYTPWISYNGLSQHISDWQITAQAGPQILALVNQYFDTPTEWIVDNSGFEASANPSTVFGWRVRGGQHVFTNVSLASHAAGQFSYWDALGSTCLCDLYNATIYGQGTVFSAFQLPVGLTENGMNDQINWDYNGNPWKGIPSNYNVTSVPYKGVYQLAGRWTGEGGIAGNASTPYSKDDLIIWPRDLVFSSSTPWSTYVQPDSTSISGSYMIVTSGTQFKQFNQFVQEGNTGDSLVVGTNLPVTGLTVNLVAKCLSGSTFSPEAAAVSGSLATPSFSCNTSYQSYTFNLPLLASDSGKSLFIGGASGTNTFQAASWQLVPWAASINGKTNPIPLTSTLTVPAALVSANSCNSGTPVTIAGISTTSALSWPSPNADPSAVTGFSPTGTTLYFVVWPTANTYNWKICNNSASGVTPGSSTTWNIGAIL